MAQNITERINYFLQIDVDNKEHLASVRKWNNLKVAFDKNTIWISNFEFYQIDSLEVKTIPQKKLFYSKNGKLFLLNSLLPDCKEPSLLWTPIERALPIEILKYNHNYFGLTEKIEIKLIKDTTEKKVEVLYTSLDDLLSYAETAPKIRLDKIKWVLINNENVLLFGTPILPINAEAFYKIENAIIPTGYKMELEILHKTVNEKINPENDSWIIWNTDSNYYKVEKSILKQLSLSSIRKTKREIEQEIERMQINV